MTAAPYRAPKKGAERRLRVFPMFRMGVVPALLFFGVLPPCLFLFLWSRLVDVDCTRGASDLVTCVVSEEALLTGKRRQVLLEAPTLAYFAGQTSRARGDTWVEVVTRRGAVPLTSGFNTSKGDQQMLALDLTEFFGAGAATTFHGRFGTRWGSVPIPIVTVAMAFAFWLYVGQSVTFVRRGSPPALAVETRRWPLPARRYSFELRQVERVEIGPDPKSRLAPARAGANLIVRTVGGERVVLGMLDGKKAAVVVARIAEFFREAAGDS